mmetsp:Transcript_110728/g.226582  ORF Transcript_110728/g.226582 Transcript_110728/m.226582 type:complete len:338 (-) Transcript_110728:185-1198(-)
MQIGSKKEPWVRSIHPSGQETQIGCRDKQNNRKQNKEENQNQSRSPGCYESSIHARQQTTPPQQSNLYVYHEEEQETNFPLAHQTKLEANYIARQRTTQHSTNNLFPCVFCGRSKTNFCCAHAHRYWTACVGQEIGSWFRNFIALHWFVRSISWHPIRCESVQSLRSIDRACLAAPPALTIHNNNRRKQLLLFGLAVFWCCYWACLFVSFCLFVSVCLSASSWLLLFVLGGSRRRVVPATVVVAAPIVGDPAVRHRRAHRRDPLRHRPLEERDQVEGTLPGDRRPDREVVVIIAAALPTNAAAVLGFPKGPCVEEPRVQVTVVFLLVDGVVSSDLCR